MRFFPIDVYEYEGKEGLEIFFFSRDENSDPVTVRIPYWESFYVKVDDYQSLCDALNNNRKLTNLWISEDVKTMSSIIDPHHTVDVVEVRTGSSREKGAALSTLRSAGFTVHESSEKIKPYLKCISKCGVSIYSWLQCECRSVQESVTTNPEYIGDVNTLAPYEGDLMPPQMSIASFDIETNSGNPNEFPQAMGCHENRIFNICITYEGVNAYKEYNLILGPDTSEFSDDTVVTKVFKTEIDLIYEFFHLIGPNGLDPDIITGHNIMDFDIPYIVDRLKLNTSRSGAVLPNISKIKKYQSTTRHVEWRNNQISINVNMIKAPGRLFIDTLVIAAMGMLGSLEDNKLDTVARSILHMKKDDMNHKDMFIIHSLWWNGLDVGNHYERIVDRHNIKMPKEKSASIHSVNELIQIINNIRQREEKIKFKGINDTVTEEMYQEYRQMTRECIRNWNIDIRSDEDNDTKIRTLMWTVCKYCLQDTRIPHQVLKKTNMLTILREEGNAFNSLIHDIIYSGQVSKVYNSMYRYIHREGYLMDLGPKGGLSSTYNYEGGLVQAFGDGLTLDNDHVILTFDFGSQYPLNVIAYNICLTTWVPEHMRNPYYEDGSENPNYIWNMYKDQVERRIRELEYQC